MVFTVLNWNEHAGLLVTVYWIFPTHSLGKTFSVGTVQSHIMWKDWSRNWVEKHVGDIEDWKDTKDLWSTKNIIYGDSINRLYIGIKILIKNSSVIMALNQTWSHYSFYSWLPSDPPFRVWTAMNWNLKLQIFIWCSGSCRQCSSIFMLFVVCAVYFCCLLWNLGKKISIILLFNYCHVCAV